MKNLILDKILLFTLLSISLLFGAGEKLEIIKSASPQYIEGNRTIHYTLTIRNTSKSVNYNSVTIHDNIDEELFDDINITITNTSEGTFTCDVNTSDTASEISCVGNMIKDSIRYIEYDVIAPNTPGQITNEASVYYNNTKIVSSEVTVTIFPNYLNNLDYKRDVCYLPPLAQGTDCKQSGAFFYGTDCNTSVQIQRNTTDGTTAGDLSNLHIFKSYTSAIESTDCYSIVNDGLKVPCTGNQNIDDLLNKDSSLYLELAFTEAHDFSLGNFAPDYNATLTDINTVPVSGKGANEVTSFQYIALIAQYNIGADTVEEYIYPCDGIYGVPPTIAPLTSGGINDADLNNADITQPNAATYIDYANYDKVGTKIVKQPFIVGVTYLDAEGNPDTYDGEFDDGKTLNAPVVLTYEANGKTDIPLWAGELPHGESHILTIEMEGLNDNGNTQNPYPIINEAFRNGKIKISLVDYGSFFRAVDGLQCAQSSLESSLCLLPACLNSNQQILKVFPIENYPHVATCLYGDGGGASPCDSNAYVGNCGGKKVTISPPKYNNDYGCAMCIADATSQPSYSNIFSTRPKDFSLKVPEWENGLNQAGVGYGIDLNGTTGTSNLNNINEISNTTTSDYYNTTLEGYYPPEVIAVIGLEDNASLSCPYDSNESQIITFVNGHSASEIKYSNVGKVKLVIMDQNWTQVDQNISYPNNSTCIVDSNETNPILDPLNRGRVGCKLITEKSMIFVPHHFDIDANLTDHNNIDNFTYLHDINRYDSDDNYLMGASLTMDIKAMNFDSNVTSNYMETCYAKETNLTLVLSGTDITYPSGQNVPLEYFLYYNPLDDNGSTDSGEGNDTLPTPIGNTISIPSLSIGNIASTFPADALEGNGTTHIEYKLNFDRKINLLANPFRLDLSDINMTDTDNVEDLNVIIIDRNATYYYARSRASMFFYEDITEDNVTTPNLIDVYCDLSPTVCSATGIDTVLGAINEQNWYVSMGHTPADGNITLMVGNPLIEGTGNPTINGSTSLTPTNITNWVSGVDNTVNIATNGSAVPLTVPIELVRSSDTPAPIIYTNEWLIYNPNEPMPLSPFYKVRFIGDSSWTGEGQTGYIVDTNASLKKHKKMDW